MKIFPFHLVNNRPWPLIGSLSAFSFGLGVIIIVRLYNNFPFLLSLIIFFWVSFLWGQDIYRESCFEGEHNIEVVNGFKVGILIFILSECFFFLGMFWAFLHLAQVPSIEIGIIWPSIGIQSFDPKGVPFLNTILLVSSGVSVTWCHHAIENGDYHRGILSLFLTIFLGFMFSCLQGLEYFISGFTFSCSSYSSIYFLGTGFHGLHVLIGRILLLICIFRFKFFQNRFSRIVGFECSVWYWHFVDVVWFFLYLVFYWWGV